VVGDVPDDVKRWASERDERRAARDFAAADALRVRIRERGYDIEDTPGGPVIHQAHAAVRRIPPAKVESVLDREPRFDVSVQWLVQGWPEDAARGIQAFRRHHHGRSVQHVVVDAAGSDPSVWPDEAEVVPLDRDPGWGAGRNAGLRRAAGAVVVVVDSSVEPTGDVLTPLERVLDDPTVGVAGPVGVVTDDLREFHPSEGPDVDAIEGYLMAFRREVVARAGLFDEKFRFYRAADLELSFRIRDLGYRAIAVPVPIERHEHRMWSTTPHEERDRLSKRNYYRFLDRWRGRLDLTIADRGRER
jgi:cysteinyl-tRNA synthetase